MDTSRAETGSSHTTNSGFNANALEIKRTFLMLPDKEIRKLPVMIYEPRVPGRKNHIGIVGETAARRRIDRRGDLPLQHHALHRMIDIDIFSRSCGLAGPQACPCRQGGGLPEKLSFRGPDRSALISLSGSIKKVLLISCFIYFLFS